MRDGDGRPVLAARGHETEADASPDAVVGLGLVHGPHVLLLLLSRLAELSSLAKVQVQTVLALEVDVLLLALKY